MAPLDRAVRDAAAEIGFSGVIRVDRAGAIEYAEAFGFADRAHGLPNTVDTRFAIASGTKGLTALTVVSLIEDGALALDTTARSLLGPDLPLIDERVTVEHLLAHRSGIGDYFAEDLHPEITDHVLPVSVHRLETTESYLAVLDGFPSVFAPGERFEYNNAAFVVLALLAERASGVPFHQLVAQRVCEPAGMTGTAFLRSDELPGDAALGYLFEDRPRTNVFHLPVLGSGDGGIYSTAADIRALWEAFIAGRIVSPAWVAEIVRPRSDWPEEDKRYGLGVHLHATTDVVMLEGYDAGVSFGSTHDPVTDTTVTVIANSSEGAWPILVLLETRLWGSSDPPPGSPG
jgi:CubicO group peptidase (beta-lactamase class C family)